MLALLNAAGAEVSPETQAALDAFAPASGPVAGEVHPFGVYIKNSREFCPKCDTYAVSPDEHLHIVAYNPDHDVLHKNCGRCGFGWNERCCDAH